MRRKKLSSEELRFAEFYLDVVMWKLHLIKHGADISHESIMEFIDKFSNIICTNQKFHKNTVGDFVGDKHTSN